MALIEWEVRGHVATAVLDDPDRRNALSARLRSELTERFEQFESREDLRVLILTANGSAFCAGGDLAEMPTEPRGARAFLTDILWWLATPERLSKPVIAAVNGRAFGGGLELAIACDVIIAATTATFATPEALVGLAPAFAMVRLPRMVGPSLAKRMAFTGHPLSADQALEAGLVSELAEPDELMERARALAEDMVRGAPLAQSVVKSAVNRDFGGGDLAHARDAVAQLFVTADCAEGIAAFHARRRPVFRGR